MTTTIAIIGRPNVGKSTLFNRLTRTRNALVADQPGVTRDRQYGIAEYEGRNFVLIDTGGLHDINEENLTLSEFISTQALRAVEEADIVFWLVDGRSGPSSLDDTLAQELRRICTQLFLLVNKTEGLDADEVCSEFHALGAGTPLPVSAKRGSGIQALMESVIKTIPDEVAVQEKIPDGLRISLVGRPNVGKSTLTNRILGEERMLTYAEPGTTRDSIAVSFHRQNSNYVLIDTAGIRRRSKIRDSIEKFSVVKTLEAIDRGQIIIVVIDAQEAITEQDASLIGLTADLGKSLIIAINKWDGLDADQKRRIKNQVDRKLEFAAYACIQYISALHGTGVGKLFNHIDKIGRSQALDIKSSRITEILNKAVAVHPPPLVRGRRIKLRYAHLGGHNPFRIIIHGNQTAHVPDNYLRYLSNTFRKQLKLTGTPVLISFKHSDNPYKDKRNILSKRQVEKRKRLMKHVKKGR